MADRLDNVVESRQEYPMIYPLPQSDYLRLEHRHRVRDAAQRTFHVTASRRRRRCAER